MNSDNAAENGNDEKEEEETDYIADRLGEKEVRQFREEPQTEIHHSLHKTAKPPLRMQNKTTTNRPQEQSHG